jgi:hypothetical protein
MKGILEIGVTLLAASAVLFAQQDAVPLNKAPNPSSARDVRQIVESSLAATQRHWHERRHYSYVERAESRRRDVDGRVKSEDIAISRTTLVNDVPFEQLMKRNGQPPSAWEERRQNAALGRVKRETPEQVAKQEREEENETSSLVQEVPKAFDFQLLGEETIQGRATYVLHATPHPTYQARGTYGRVLSKVEGTLWIDTQDLVWIKVDGQVIQPFSIGLFLVRLLRGSQVTIEQTRVDDGHWMPTRVEVRASATLLLLKSLVIERILTYSDYRRSASDAAVARAPAIP